jgi:Sybindin-like family
MTVHSFHIFDRRGKTLFTKRYVAGAGGSGSGSDEDNEQLAEQRKLVFGMVYSLRELSGSLSPTSSSNGTTGDLHLVKTGASTLYNYETVSGLRFVLYTTADTSTGGGGGAGGGGAGASTTVGGSSSNTPSTTIPSGNLTTGNLAINTSAMVGVGSSANNSGANTPLHGGSVHGMMTNPTITNHVRQALQHIYEHLWVNVVVRSPMYQPHDPDIRSTNFEASLVRP